MNPGWQGVRRIGQLHAARAAPRARNSALYARRGRCWPTHGHSRKRYPRGCRLHMQASPHLMLSRSVRVEIGVIRSINRTYACTTPRLLHVGVPILWYGVYTGPRPLCVGVGRPLGAWPAVGGTWVLADGLVSAAAAGGPVEGCGYPHQLGERLDLHLPHNAATMGLHRDLTDSELCRNLFVQPAGDHQSHDLPFARS